MRRRERTVNRMSVKRACGKYKKHLFSTLGAFDGFLHLGCTRCGEMEIEETPPVHPMCLCTDRHLRLRKVIAGENLRAFSPVTIKKGKAFLLSKGGTV